MPDASRQTTGGIIRVRRDHADPMEIEHGWSLIRIEPESGRVVCERDGKRILCDRREFELLNFPGSDDVWDIIFETDDNDLKKAKAAWANLDLYSAASALLRHARTLDPIFDGIQITSDLNEKISETESVCKRSMDILRLELERARLEYDRFAANTKLAHREKDRLLATMQAIEDKYAAYAYRLKIQLPAWRRLGAAIEQLSATAKKIINIA